MNWTVNDGNSQITKFFIQFKKAGEENYFYYKEQIGGKNTSFVMKDFDPSTKYMFKLQASNKIGSGPITESEWVTTLKEDPVFVPNIEVKGNSHSTITIGWHPPPADLMEYIHYYELIVTHAENQTFVEEAMHPQNSRNLPYMFDNLKTATEYLFKVRACNELTKECGNWSEVVNGTTMDGQASPPLNVEISCSYSNVSKQSSVSVKWSPPKNPNGMVLSYQVSLQGSALFKTEYGKMKNETYGPKIKHVVHSTTNAFYENVSPNTNYTVSVAGITRSKKVGEQAFKSCSMPPTTPVPLTHVLWGKVQADDTNWIFKLFLPRVSERNGPICCYRIYLIRMTSSNYDFKDSPEDYDVGTFAEAHNGTKGGVYIAEIISSSTNQSEIFLGDNKKTTFNKNLNFNGNEMCNVCLKNIYKKKIVKQPVVEEVETKDADDDEILVDIETVNGTTTTSPAAASSTAVPPNARRRRRRRRENSESKLSIYDLSLQNKEKPSDFLEIFDGKLDINSNYSGFIEVIVPSSEDDPKFVYSEYFQVISPRADPSIGDHNQNSELLNIVTHFLAALIVFVLFLICLLCLLHRYQKKNVAQGNEVVSLTDSLRALCHGRPNHHPHRSLVGNPTKPPDLPPILRENLQAAWSERHKDSDYGFQHEFELLPDRFSDRTSKNSDSKDNTFKNRYPDIKAYDQTRVKLNAMNGMVGSDYINANFVIGYKERKKFICAQVSFVD